MGSAAARVLASGPTGKVNSTLACIVELLEPPKQ
jgi:hypothetical protein